MTQIQQSKTPTEFLVGTDPAAFTGTVIVESGVLGPRHGVVAIDLVQPGCEPMPFFGKQIVRKVFPRELKRIAIYRLWKNGQRPTQTIYGYSRLSTAASPPH
jgi:Ni,Fe-hydrogenase III small subunit